MTDLIQNAGDGDNASNQQSDDDDKSTEASFTPGGVLFYVNKDGLPLSSKTLQKMWDHVAKIHPDGAKMVDNIKHCDNLPKVATPQVPVFHAVLTTASSKLQAVQHYMKQLQYNHTGMQFFEVKKNRPLSGLLEVAKDIRESLPIKCLEAVILGIYLTNGTSNLQRFPVSMKSAFSGQSHRHVVLGVYSGGHFGTIGMSRREDLMYKPMHFKSLSALVYNFEESYRNNFHVLKKVKIGWPISHNPHSMETINWKALTINLKKMTRTEVEKAIDKFVRDMKSRQQSCTGSSGTSYQHVKEVSPYSKAPQLTGKDQRNPRGYSPAVVLTAKDTEQDSD